MMIPLVARSLHHHRRSDNPSVGLCSDDDLTMTKVLTYDKKASGEGTSACHL